ncbi:MAG: hypothetical protein IPJ19_12190 [Planctomycetes bacterium]|nr:hypothetical protein [Planctomycetota bacterium]
MSTLATRPSSWPLLASLLAILALIALPTPNERSADRGDRLEPALQPAANATRGGDARFEKRLEREFDERESAAVRDAAVLWRRLMLQQALEARESGLGLFGNASSSAPSAAAGDPFGSPVVEASAPAMRVLGHGNVSCVWEGATVPLDALDGPSRWLTPSVGRVRAELADGTSFEGRLHSIGEGKVWIENDLGRVALLGAQVTSLRQLPPLAEPKSDDVLPELPLVRVRTPGGIFQGRLLRREEGRVTLLTAEGGQVTLDDAEVQPVEPGSLLRRP